MSFAGLVAGRPRRKSGFFAELLDGLKARPNHAFPMPARIAPPQGVFQPLQAKEPVAAPDVKPVLAPVVPPPVAPVAVKPAAAAPPRVVAATAVPAAVPAALALPTATRMLAMQWQQRQQKLVADINGTLGPTHSVMAWNVMPAQLFESDAGRFLMLACDTFAYAAANTMLLPVMPSGAEGLNLPRHPMASAAILQLQAQHKITSLYRQAQDDHKRAALALQAGDASAVFSSSTRQRDYQRQIAYIIRDTAEQVLGRDAVERHETRFRSLISKM